MGRLFSGSPLQSPAQSLVPVRDVLYFTRYNPANGSPLMYKTAVIHESRLILKEDISIAT
jgi:hypothetical protein